MIQIAEFTGVAGLSFMVAFANVIAVTTVRRLMLEASTRVVRPHFDLTLTLAAIVGVLTFGIRATQVSPPTKPLRVAAVQSNVPQNQKFDPQFTRKIFDQFRHLSEIALRSNPPPDLLIWPRRRRATFSWARSTKRTAMFTTRRSLFQRLASKCRFIESCIWSLLANMSRAGTGYHCSRELLATRCLVISKRVRTTPCSS